MYNLQMDRVQETALLLFDYYLNFFFSGLGQYYYSLFLARSIVEVDPPRRREGSVATLSEGGRERDYTSSSTSFLLFTCSPFTFQSQNQTPLSCRPSSTPICFETSSVSFLDRLDSHHPLYTARDLINPPLFLVELYSISYSSYLKKNQQYDEFKRSVFKLRRRWIHRFFNTQKKFQATQMFVSLPESYYEYLYCFSSFCFRV